MIEERIFRAWLEEAVAFANLRPNPPTDIADSVFSCARPFLLDLPWYGPEERSYEELRREWRRFLRRVVDGRLRMLPKAKASREYSALERVCTDWSMSRFGQSNLITASEDVSPFGFDDEHRPQLGFLHASRPEGLLAVVGAELVAPGAAFGVRTCRAVGCEDFFSVRLAQRGKGRPPNYCAEHRNASARGKRYQKEHSR